MNKSLSPLVSIVIPVYNAAYFLRPCIESLLKQTYSNWELIAVVDGSTDNSINILHKFSTKDPRIHIIEKENEGVSIARNVALDVAKGKYVYFTDADDLVHSNGLDILVKIAEENNATLVKADYQAIGEHDEPVFANKKHILRRKSAKKILNADDFDRKVLMEEYFLWTCLFSMNVIRKHHIQFLPHCRLMEDADFIMNYLIHSERNVYVSTFVYGYRKHSGAATGIRKDYSNDLKSIIDHLYPMQHLSYIKRLLCNIAISYYMEYNRMNKPCELPQIKYGTKLYQCVQKKLFFAPQIVMLHEFYMRINILFRYKATILLNLKNKK